VQAVEKYSAGLDPEEAVQVEAVTEIDTKALTRAVVKGEWGDVARYLQQAPADNVVGVRNGVIAYLKVILLEESEITVRTKAVADALTVMCELQNASDLIQGAALSAQLYKVTSIFSEYKR
jgi:hypothetical protein